MTALTLAKAALIVDKALERGRALKFKPLTVAVLDAGGHLVAFKREDGSSLLRPQIAEGKAWGVLGMGFGGREFARRATAAPVFLSALMAASGTTVAMTSAEGVYSSTAPARTCASMSVSPPNWLLGKMLIWSWPSDSFLMRSAASCARTLSGCDIGRLLAYL